MGEVYLAIDQRLGNPVALKRTMFTDDEAMAGAFEREARTLARLRHPALPKVSDHFTENDNQYLVMEHISGDDLAKRLASMGKPFPMSWVLFWADQLLEALAYLHANEPPIIHRDIKPQNLKLTDENNIILLDFGLSKSGLGQQADPSSGSSGSIVGYTPHFAPMEQIRGTGTNPKSDIYSLSATLYQLLSNMIPPDALTRADALLSGSTDPLEPLSTINSEVPKAVSDVIAKGMAVSQEHRHATAREMQKYLRDAFSRAQNGAAESEPGPEIEIGAKTVLMEPEPVVTRQESGAPEGGKPTDPDIGEATLIYNQPPQPVPDSVPTNPRQSDIKTEVFSAGSLDVPPPAKEGDRTGSAVQSGTGSLGVSGSDRESPVRPSGELEQPTAAPALDATVAFDAPGLGRAPSQEAAAAAEAGAGEFSPAPQGPRGKKSSKGILIGLFVGLVVVGVLLLGGGGAAYYFLMSAPSGTNSSNTASPTPTGKPSPGPVPSAESTPGANSSGGNSNPQIAVPTPQPTPAATPDTSGPRPKPQSKPQPQPKQQPTPRPTRQIPL